MSAQKKRKPVKSPYKFPCDFPIKALGLANEEFEKAVLSIILEHVPNLSENSIRTRLSKDGKYLSMTITIHAKSKAQLDRIYLDLTACEVVLVAL